MSRDGGGLPWRTLGEGLGLALALLFVFSSMFIPHLDTFNDQQGLDEDDPAIFNLGEAMWQYWVSDEREGYPYTMHVDENVHWNYIAGIQRTDTVFVDWVTGDETNQEGFFSLRGAVHERGFHLLFAEVQELTGLSWYSIFLYGPALWFTFTAFGVWAMLRPSPAAIPAAAFVGLGPTTARFLGPAFLVPIGFSLAWLPATQILSEPGRKKATSAMLLLLVVAWAFFVHLIGGFAAVGLLLLGGLLGTAAQRKRALALLGVGLIPLVWLFRSFQSGIQTEIEKIGDLPIDFTIFDGFGLSALGLAALGLLILTLWPPDEEDSPIPTWAAFSMGALGLIVASVAVFDQHIYATYDRWHPVFFFAAAVPAGYAVVRITQLVHVALQDMLPDRRVLQTSAATIALVASLSLSGAVASDGTETHLEEPYYHVMDDRSWDRFQWVDENVGDEYEVFLAHPWRAPVLAAMSGKDPHAYLNPGSPPINGEDYRRYAETGGSLRFFITNDITTGVTSGKPPFEEFHNVRDGVWVMNETLANEIAEIRERETRGD